MAEWHYNGSFGPLGPLKDDQMQELIEFGVIEQTTLVWRQGLADWIQARNSPELLPHFENAFSSPPPLPVVPDLVPAPEPVKSMPPPLRVEAIDVTVTTVTTSVVSDKSRVMAGILNLVPIVPGLGRIYLGYSALGFLQLATTFCGGIGALWSMVDGIAILAGSCPTDGYGRKLLK